MLRNFDIEFCDIFDTCTVDADNVARLFKYYDGLPYKPDVLLAELRDKYDKALNLNPDMLDIGAKIEWVGTFDYLGREMIPPFIPFNLEVSSSDVCRAVVARIGDNKNPHLSMDKFVKYLRENKDNWLMILRLLTGYVLEVQWEDEIVSKLLIHYIFMIYSYRLGICVDKNREFQKPKYQANTEEEYITHLAVLGKRYFRIHCKYIWFRNSCNKLNYAWSHYIPYPARGTIEDIKEYAQNYNIKKLSASIKDLCGADYPSDGYKGCAKYISRSIYGDEVSKLLWLFNILYHHGHKLKSDEPEEEYREVYKYMCYIRQILIDKEESGTLQAVEFE